MVFTHPKTVVAPSLAFGCERKGLADGGVLLAASASSRLVKNREYKHRNSLTAMQISRCHVGNRIKFVRFC